MRACPKLTERAYRPATPYNAELAPAICVGRTLARERPQPMRGYAKRTERAYWPVTPCDEDIAPQFVLGVA